DKHDSSPDDRNRIECEQNGSAQNILQLAAMSSRPDPADDSKTNRNRQGDRIEDKRNRQRLGDDRRHRTRLYEAVAQARPFDRQLVEAKIAGKRADAFFARDVAHFPADLPIRPVGMILFYLRLDLREKRPSL